METNNKLGEFEINKIYCVDWIKGLKKLPDESIDMCMTSPPYYGLRDYGLEPIIFDGDSNCEHEFELKEKQDPMYRTGSGDHDKGGIAKTITEMKTRADGFCIKCNAWKGSLGLEPHPNLFIKHLVDGFRILKQKLKKSGSFYLNLGDSYFGSPAGNKDQSKESGEGMFRGRNNLRESNIAKEQTWIDIKNNKSNWLQPKQLMLMPSRIAIAMQDDGWILRNDIIWNKPNPMPSSVKDRLNNTYEHIFHFVKSRKYFYDLDAIREPHKQDSIEGSLNSLDKKINDRTQELILKLYNIKKEIRGQSGYQGKSQDLKNWDEVLDNSKAFRDGLDILKIQENLTGDEIEFLKDYVQNHFGHPLGKNPSDFWIITTQPFKESHFATFPEKLCEKPIKSSCPSEICVKCGFIRERIIETNNPSKEFMEWDENRLSGAKGSIQTRQCIKSLHRNKSIDGKSQGVYYSGITKGYTSCKCGEEFEAGIVLDIFAGSGTTCLVAKELGRNYIGFELNPKYVEMATKRVNGWDYKDFQAEREHKPLTQFIEGK